MPRTTRSRAPQACAAARVSVLAAAATALAVTVAVTRACAAIVWIGRLRDGHSYGIVTPPCSRIDISPGQIL